MTIHIPRQPTPFSQSFLTNPKLPSGALKTILLQAGSQVYQQKTFLGALKGSWATTHQEIRRLLGTLVLNPPIHSVKLAMECQTV